MWLAGIPVAEDQVIELVARLRDADLTTTPDAASVIDLTRANSPGDAQHIPANDQSRKKWGLARQASPICPMRCGRTYAATRTRSL